MSSEMSPNKKELHIITGLFTNLLSFRVLTSHLLSLRMNVIINNRECLLITESLVFKYAARTGIKLQNTHCNSFLYHPAQNCLVPPLCPQRSSGSLSLNWCAVVARSLRCANFVLWSVYSFMALCLSTYTKWIYYLHPYVSVLNNNGLWVGHIPRSPYFLSQVW